MTVSPILQGTTTALIGWLLGTSSQLLLSHTLAHLELWELLCGTYVGTVCLLWIGAQLVLENDTCTCGATRETLYLVSALNGIVSAWLYMGAKEILVMNLLVWAVSILSFLALVRLLPPKSKSVQVLDPDNLLFNDQKHEPLLSLDECSNESFEPKMPVVTLV